MNDIITDVIAKNQLTKIKNNRPIENNKLKVVLNDYEMEHLKNCNKQICSICSEIAKK